MVWCEFIDVTGEMGPDHSYRDKEGNGNTACEIEYEIELCDHW